MKLCVVFISLLSFVKLGSSFDCDDGCSISDYYVDDNDCDCSGCEDESSWNCTTCACPTTCGDYYNCDYYTTYYDYNYTCSDGCEIPGSWQNDNICDCIDCGDEMYWNCTTCSCPTTCGDYGWCYSWDLNTNYTCNDGCEIPSYYVNDDWCDCSDCGDEDSWTCDDCDCPDSCGEYSYCNTFSCDDGCDIYSSYQNDGWCDCSECEDEDYYTCDSCGGCPTTCGDWQYCGSSYSYNYSSTFTCSDGCSIYYSWVNDDYCDCSDCGDEMTTGWDCDNCQCPTYCGDYYHCESGSGGSWTWGEPNGTTASAVCSDGCVIPAAWLDDNFCDCTDCGDESDWNCDDCNCPSECGDYSYCGPGSSSGGSDSATSSGVFNQGTDAGRAALAFLIIGIIVLIVVVILIVSKTWGHKDTSHLQEQRQGIIDLDGNAELEHGGVGAAATGGGRATHNGTLAEPESEKPPQYEQPAKPVNTWNQMIDLPEDDPQNTNDNDNGGEASVQQGGAPAGNIVLPEQPKVTDQPTPGNDDPFNED